MNGNTHPMRVMGSMLTEIALATVPAMEPTVSPNLVAIPSAPLGATAALEAAMKRSDAGIAIDGTVTAFAAVPRSRRSNPTSESECEQSRCKEATHISTSSLGRKSTHRATRQPVDRPRVAGDFLRDLQ